MLKFFFKLTDSNWLLSASEWIALLEKTASELSELNCSELTWIELTWTELDWTGLDQTRLDRTGMDWTHWIELNIFFSLSVFLSSLSFCLFLWQLGISYVWLILSNLSLIHHFVCASIRCQCLSVFQPEGLKSSSVFAYQLY